MSTRISTFPLWKSTAIPAIIQPFRIQLLGTHQLIYPCTYPRWRKVLLPSFCESLTSVPYARTSINTDRRTRRSRYVRFSRHIVGSMFHPRDLSWHKGTLCVRASPSSRPPTLSRNPLLRPTDPYCSCTPNRYLATHLMVPSAQTYCDCVGTRGNVGTTVWSVTRDW